MIGNLICLPTGDCSLPVVGLLGCLENLEENHPGLPSLHLSPSLLSPLWEEVLVHLPLLNGRESTGWRMTTRLPLDHLHPPRGLPLCQDWRGFWPEEQVNEETVSNENGLLAWPVDLGSWLHSSQRGEQLSVVETSPAPVWAMWDRGFFVCTRKEDWSLVHKRYRGR